MTARARLQIREGSRIDLTAVLGRLTEAGLPTRDFYDTPGFRMWVLDAGGSVEGVIALERHGTEALLRSLAVTPTYRQQNYGRELVACLESAAAAAGVEQLILLTETAERFFRLLGYVPVERRNVSEPLRQCAEFRFLCPASAACLGKSLLKDRTEAIDDTADGSPP